MSFLKEFVMRHPFITFLIICAVGDTISECKNGKRAEDDKEDDKE